MRNPHGGTEWEGDWSDKWDGWTDELKEQLSWSDKEDGQFFMPYSNFKSRYETTGFAMSFHKNQRPPRQMMWHNCPTQYYEITFEQDFNPNEKTLAFVALQGGKNKIKNYILPEDLENKFEAAPIFITMFEGDGSKDLVSHKDKE